MTSRHLIASCVALAVLASVSVASASGVDVAARVGIGSTASRADPPPYDGLDPDTRAARDLIELINAYRRDHGVGPLALQSQLSLAAERHAAELAVRGTLSHTGANGSTASQRLAAVGLDLPVAENLGSGFQAPQALIEAWLASPAHAANLLLDFDFIGAGVRAVDGRTPYWVVMIAAG